MSGNRIELIVSFWVGSESGREDARRVIGRLEGIARHGGFHGVSEFEVRPWTVNGNDWDAKWPPTCGARSEWRRWGGILGPCVSDTGHGGWHLDGAGASWGQEEE